MVIMVTFAALWLAVCGFAIWRGGRPERVAAVMFLLAFPASILVHRLEWRAGDADLGIMAVDGAMLLALVLLAMRADRYWPIAMAAMQVLQIVGHLLELIDPGTIPLIYWLANVVWAYPMLILLALATVRHVNRVKRSGPEPSWSSSSSPP